MPAQEERRQGRILVISDTHFGDDSMLLDDERLVERFVEVLAARGPFSELVLLGDVLDLWVSTLMPALRGARRFIEAITGLAGVEKVVYVPGNHDHQMFMDAFRLEMEKLVAKGDLATPKFMPARTYDETLLSRLAHTSRREHMKMTYPFLVRRLGGREVVLTHGHHLDFYAASHGWARTFWLGRHVLKKRRRQATLHDIEMANIPFCGAMSVAPWVPELVSEGLRYYHIISFFGRLFRSESMRRSPLRDSLIKENYKEIERLLPQLGYPRPACFVFGHTHRPGIGKLPGAEVAIANTGSWTRLEDEEVPSRTWVELDDAGEVKLFRLARDGEELLDSVSLK
jgi:UDP-2,3-diacylglucosamine pyrophosphatase LpxH